QEMWMLLGDPALKLPVCRPTINLTTNDTPAAGKTIVVKGSLPEQFAQTTLRLTLERPVGSTPPGLEVLPKDPAKAKAVMLANHERANSVVLVTREVEPREGWFECTLKLPAEIPWPRLVVRGVAENKSDMALGVLTLPVGK